MAKQRENGSDAGSGDRNPRTETPDRLHAGEPAPSIASVAKLADAEALGSLPVPALWLKADGAVTDANPAACDLLGYRREDLLSLGFVDLFPDLADPWKTLRSHARTSKQEPVITRGHGRAGQTLSILLQPATSGGNGERLVCLFLYDQSDEDRLAVSALERLDLAATSGRVCLYQASHHSGPVIDGRCSAMLGFSPGELDLDLDGWMARIHPDDRIKIELQMQRMIETGEGRFEAEYRIRHRDGHWIWVLDRSETFERDANGRPISYAGSLVDITGVKGIERRLEFLVEHDDLTGLQNRRGLMHAMQRIHARCLRHSAPYCVAMLDLDHFKRINDLHGHDAGDRVLATVAQTLRREVRREDWLGRWGGEEFVVLLPDSTEPQAEFTLERLRQAVAAQRIEASDGRVQITVSAGIAGWGGSEDAIEEVLARADAALYRAKRAGRNRVYVSGADRTCTESVPVAVTVQEAVQHAGVRPAFQPVVALADRHVVAEDALARIVTPDGRVLNATAFLQIATQLNLLHRIDEMLLAATIDHLMMSGTDHTPCFVHISGGLMRKPERLATLVDAVDGTSLGLERLVLTVDERQVIERTSQVSEALAEPLRRGCRLALAGFGGAHASYRLLSHLPVSFLDIDSDLVKLARGSQQARNVLRSIREGAVPLGVTTLVKCIEHEQDALLLREIGIDWASGYLFGPPSGPVPHQPSGYCPTQQT
jgi:diguanylate cyclase (GGDEF)-like protein/PAS domain S-box-containing protein